MRRPDRGVLRQIPEPQHRLVAVSGARRVGLELLTPREELEKPYRSINRRALRTRSSPTVRHNRSPFLATEQTVVHIAEEALGDTADTRPLCRTDQWRTAPCRCVKPPIAQGKHEFNNPTQRWLLPKRNEAVSDVLAMWKEVQQVR